MEALLQTNQIRAGYAGINVLWDVSLDLPQGRTLAVIGPNGAGKTTLLRTIMGLVTATNGDIRVAGESILRRPTWDRVRQGLVMIPEGRLLFGDLSVEDNLKMGAYPEACRKTVKAGLEKMYAYFPRLQERRRQLSSSLSGGEAQMLAIARGLMSQPRICLVDEPSLGLAPTMVDEIFSILTRLKAEGLSLIVVEQNTRRAVGLADHVYLLQAGRIILSQAADQVDVGQLHKLYFSQARQESAS